MTKYVIAPTSSCGRMTTTHERTQAMPPRPQMRGSRRSTLTAFHHCRAFGVLECRQVGWVTGCFDGKEGGKGKKSDSAYLV
jgi:hypothetical protein